MFVAEIRAKNGRMMFKGAPRETRDEAARFAFQYGPQAAKVCSTSGTYRDPSGNWRSNGMDIRWHKREEVWREPAKPCDHGLFSDEADQLDLIEASLFRDR